MSYPFEVTYPFATPEIMTPEIMTPEPQDFAGRKSHALQTARLEAEDLRNTVTNGIAPERLAGHVVKMLLALLWQVSDALPKDDPLKAALSEIAKLSAGGFAAEAHFAGEDATNLRERTLARALALFQSNQIIEGIERKAEADLAEVTTDKALTDALITLRTLQRQGMAQITALNKEGGNDAD